MDIAFIGLGRMGGPIARRILEAGHRLAVHDLRPGADAALVELGAERSDSAQTAAAGAELVFVCLPGPAEVETAVLGPGGVLEGCRPGMIYVDLSTNSLQVVRRIGERMRERGCDALDAPVSGGVTGAEHGTLQVMVGGERETYDQILPVLQRFGRHVTLVGPAGSGTVAKLVHNLIYIATRSVLAEGFTLGVKAGVSPEALLDVVRGSAFGQGLMLSHFLPEMVFKDSFEPVRFAMDLARKDVGLATQLGRELDVPMAMAALTEQTLVEAVARGWGAKDYGTAFLLQEERAGVRVRTGTVAGETGRAD